MRRKTIGRFLLRSLLSIIAFAISIVNALQMENGNLAAFFLNLFGGIPPALGDSSMVFVLLFLNIPWILMLYLFAPLFLQDFSVQYVYLFTRVGSKGRWLWQKTARLFLQVCVSWGMVFLLCGLVGAACGFSPVGSPVLYVELFALEVLGVFTLSFAQNLLSLKLGLTQSFVLAVCTRARCCSPPRCTPSPCFPGISCRCCRRPGRWPCGIRTWRFRTRCVRSFSTAPPAFSSGKAFSSKSFTAPPCFWEARSISGRRT